jgi:hypothetical protein
MRWLAVPSGRQPQSPDSLQRSQICARVYITIRIDRNIVECYLGRETASARLQERNLPVDLCGNSNQSTYAVLTLLGSIQCSSGRSKIL